MLHVSHTPLLVCTALCRRWILSGDHYKVISCWGVECRSLTSKKQRPDTEGEWSNRWTGLRKLTLSSFISSSWSFVSCCLFSCYCSNTHTHTHGHTPAMQSQLLLGVDVMLTLMDQLCDQPDPCAWGVYFCGRPTAATLMWFYPESDVMMAALAATCFSCSVNIFIALVFLRLCRETWTSKVWNSGPPTVWELET